MSYAAYSYFFSSHNIYFILYNIYMQYNIVQWFVSTQWPAKKMKAVHTRVYNKYSQNKQTYQSLVYAKGHWIA